MTTVRFAGIRQIMNQNQECNKNRALVIKGENNSEMEKFIINGGNPLKGDIWVSGAKNSAVAILPAVLLLDVPCIIENVPDISDVKICLKILKGLGADIRQLDKQGNTYWISCKNVKDYYVPYDEAKKMRASYYFLGALLGRCNNARAAMPGGCPLGARPIDQHLKAFEILGAEQIITDPSSDIVALHANWLHGDVISFDVVSVGATMNAILAAVKAEGTTIIENAAKEPHIVDLANFLNYMGAHIKGAGTDTIRVTGVKKMGGSIHSVIPDRIETGTFMLAAAITRGDVLVKNALPGHVRPIIAKLKECGVEVDVVDDGIYVNARDKELIATNIKTLPYPGFPTDIQSPFMAFLTTVKGSSEVKETVFENRFMHVNELNRMGADISVENRVAYIPGGKKLHGATVRATDLRAGAAMIIAGLAAEGKTEVSDIYHIERGYEKFVEKFAGLGATLTRVED